MIEKLTPEQAAAYFCHPSQVKASGMGGDLPDWMEYRTYGGVCGAFQPHLWPGIWMGHLAALPEARGHAVKPMRAILAAFCNEVGAERIIGWVKENNRAALALCRRAGFETDGVLPLAEPVVMIGWKQ